MSEGRVSSHHVGNRILGNPFASLGESWCPTCRVVVECDTASSHRGTQYVWSRRCPRCGTVVSWGAYQNVPILDGVDAKKQRRAIAFVTTPGADRRGPKRGRACL